MKSVISQKFKKSLVFGILLNLFICNQAWSIPKATELPFISDDILGEIFQAADWKPKEILKLMDVCPEWRDIGQLSCRSLSFKGMEEKVTDERLRWVAEKFPHLKAIDLSHCNKITDAGLGYLAQHCTGLRKIDLFYGAHITNIGLGYLAQGCAGLHEINLYAYSQITDTELQHLQRCTGLRSINLCDCDKITDVGLGCLAQSCPGLRRIELSCSKYLDEFKLSRFKACYPSISIILRGIAGIEIEKTSWKKCVFVIAGMSAVAIIAGCTIVAAYFPDTAALVAKAPGLGWTLTKAAKVGQLAVTGGKYVAEKFFDGGKLAGESIVSGWNKVASLWRGAEQAVDVLE